MKRIGLDVVGVVIVWAVVLTSIARAGDIVSPNAAIEPAAMAISPQGTIGETDAGQYGCVCRVHQGNSSGSGVLVAPAVIITAKHVTRGRAVIVTFPTAGHTCRGTVFKEHPGADVSVVVLDTKVPGVRPAAIAPRDHDGREPITVAGFGGEKRLGFFATLIRHMRGRDRQNNIWLGAPISGGDSGGPAFDSQGYVVAVNSTSDRVSLSSVSGDVEWMRTQTAAASQQFACGGGASSGASGNGMASWGSSRGSSLPPTRPRPIDPDVYSPRTDRPPALPPQLVPVAPPTPQPICPPAPQIDEAALVAKITAIVLARIPKQEPQELAIDYGDLTREVARRLPPVVIELENPNGDRVRQEKKLGDVAVFKMRPKSAGKTTK